MTVHLQIENLDILLTKTEDRYINVLKWITSGIENPSKSELIGRCGGDEKTE